MEIKKDNRTELAYEFLMSRLNVYNRAVANGEGVEIARYNLVEEFKNAERTFRGQIDFCQGLLKTLCYENVHYLGRNIHLKKENSETVDVLHNKIIWHERLIEKIEALATSLGISDSEIKGEAGCIKRLEEMGESVPKGTKIEEEYNHLVDMLQEYQKVDLQTSEGILCEEELISSFDRSLSVFNKEVNLCRAKAVALSRTLKELPRGDERYYPLKKERENANSMQVFLNLLIDNVDGLVKRFGFRERVAQRTRTRWLENGINPEDFCQNTDHDSGWEQ